MSLPLKHTYRFDSFVVDVEEQVLLRDGRMVPLTPKVFETLLLLVKHQGSIVSKKTILETLWPDVFVEESNITFNITKLRKALGDTTRPSIYIETIPRRGYRFKTEVREVKDVEDVVSGDTSSANNGNSQNGHHVSQTLLSTDAIDIPLEQVENILEPSTSSLASDKKRRFTFLFAVIAALTLLAGVAAGAWRFLRASQRLPAATTQQTVMASLPKADLNYEQISAYGNVIAAAISPDAKQVVYVQENAGRQSVWLMQLGSYVNSQLIPPADCAYNKVSFSHDGDYIYFVRHPQNESSDLYRIPILNGPAIKLHENVEGSYSLTTDDRRVVFRRRNFLTREDTLFIADLNGGEEKRLVTHQEPDWIRGYSLSPDGKTVVYATGETDSTRQTMSIREVSVETGQTKLLLNPNWYYIRQIEWLPDGDGLLLLVRENATVNAQIWRMSYPDCALLKLSNDLNNYLLFSVDQSASEMIAVQSVLASNIWVSTINGRNAKNVADGRGRLIWTADGHIIYNSGSVLGSDLWLVNPDGSAPRQLSFNAGFNDWPAISPDGKTVVFQSNRTGAQHLWRMDLDGSNQAQLTNAYAERNAAVSPDGQWVYYNSSENNFLWKIPSHGGQPLQLTNEYAAYPSVSPDGKLIATFHFPRHAHEAQITVRNCEDMKTVAELTLAPGFWISRSIEWEPDSTSLVYAIQTNGKVRLFRQSINSSLQHEITTLKAEDEFEFTFSPDRRQLAFTSTKWNHYAVLIDGFK
ncbi:MAG: hypothetical protein C5B55_02755 [Blastocatellia bacterium]|nr:MAG: hypothetical protein C5B55_02755 [Blastocatellia bacterium]